MSGPSERTRCLLLQERKCTGFVDVGPALTIVEESPANMDSRGGSSSASPSSLRACSAGGSSEDATRGVLTLLDTAACVCGWLHTIGDLAALACALNSSALRRATELRCSALLASFGAPPPDGLLSGGRPCPGVPGLLHACFEAGSEAPASDALAALYDALGRPVLADKWAARALQAGAPGARVLAALRMLTLDGPSLQSAEAEAMLVSVATDDGHAAGPLWRARAHLLLAWLKPRPDPASTYRYPSPLPHDERSHGVWEDRMVSLRVEKGALGLSWDRAAPARLVAPEASAAPQTASSLAPPLRRCTISPHISLGAPLPRGALRHDQPGGAASLRRDELRLPIPTELRRQPSRRASRR